MTQNNPHKAATGEVRTVCMAMFELHDGQILGINPHHVSCIMPCRGPAALPNHCTLVHRSGLAFDIRGSVDAAIRTIQSAGVKICQP